MTYPITPEEPIIVHCEVVSPSKTVSASLLLDTGCLKTIINPRLLETAGLQTAPGQTIAITTASGIVQCHATVLPILSGLGVTRMNFTVLAHALPVDAPIDGLLGLDFLRDLRLILDWKRRLMEVEG